MLAPVPVGVEILEGISEVNMVADEGEMMYLAWIVDRRASWKPVFLLAGSCPSVDKQYFHTSNS